MELLLRVAIAAGISLLGGAVAGFVAAVLALWARQLRNSILVARGGVGIRDCILPLPYVMMSAVTSLLLGGILGVFLTASRAALFGALVPAGLLALLSLTGAIFQAFSD